MLTLQNFQTENTIDLASESNAKSKKRKSLIMKVTPSTKECYFIVEDETGFRHQGSTLEKALKVYNSIRV